MAEGELRPGHGGSEGEESASESLPKRPRYTNFTGKPAFDRSRGHAESQLGLDVDDPNISAEDLLEQMVAAQAQAAAPQASAPAPSPGVGGDPAFNLQRSAAPLEPVPPPPGFDITKWKTILCSFFQTGTCRKGRADCSFAHGVEDMARPLQSNLKTTRMDFSAGTEVNRVSRQFNIPEGQVTALMTEATKQVLVDVTGVQDVEWDHAKRKVRVAGTAVQVEKAGVLLQRAATHCHWGVSEAKIAAILRPRTGCTSARCTLSPMVPSLQRFSAILSPGRPSFTLGTGKENALVVKGAGVSRSHASFEFVPGRGVVYILDTSTNGTFLNGRRLPDKAKVIIWHGDELLLQDPKMPSQAGEFGYMVNLEID